MPHQGDTINKITRTATGLVAMLAMVTFVASASAAGPTLCNAASGQAGVSVLKITAPAHVTYGSHKVNRCTVALHVAEVGVGFTVNHHVPRRLAVATTGDRSGIELGMWTFTTESNSEGVDHVFTLYVTARQGRKVVTFIE
jgi:hypothetical protein